MSRSGFDSAARRGEVPLSGTLSGRAGYGFMLMAIDGQVKGGGGVDKFRTKIWRTADQVVVYDNELGAADDAAPTTALGGGSIVVHAK